MRKKDGQRGIVIGPILFLIAIIGVLAAAIAAGIGGFGGSSSTASAKVMASAIIDYADTVKIGVDRVLANGCGDTEISFENPIVSGYDNPNAPADERCNVFSVNGGGISFLPIKVSSMEIGNDGYFEFQGVHSFLRLGKTTGDGTGAELVTFLPIDSENLCKKLNEMLGMAGYLGKDMYFDPSVYSFRGTYGHNNTMVNNGGTWIQGQIMGCVQTTIINPATDRPSYAPYFFYAVLIVR